MPLIADDVLLTKALLQRFAGEAVLEGGNGQYYAFVRLSNGNLLAHHPGSPPIVAEQTMWASDVLRRLNRELHHDGAWVVVFTAPQPGGEGIAIYAQPNHVEYARYVIMWMDSDGDVQFSMEWVKNESDLLDFADVLIAGLESTMGKAEAAWETWHRAMRQVIDPKEGQTYARAKGQRAARARLCDADPGPASEARSLDMDRRGRLVDLRLGWRCLCAGDREVRVSHGRRGPISHQGPRSW